MILNVATIKVDCHAFDFVDSCSACGSYVFTERDLATATPLNIDHFRHSTAAVLQLQEEVRVPFQDWCRQMPVK